MIKEIFDSFLARHQEGLEKSMKCSDFVFYFVGGSPYKCHNVTINPGNHIKYREKLRKNATINPQV